MVPQTADDHNINNDTNSTARQRAAVGDESVAWRAEQPFEKCRVGSMCVCLNTTDNGPNTPYIYVGKILQVDPKERTFTVIN